MFELIRKLFWLEGPVSRVFYVTAGLVLAVLKYAIEAVALAWLAGKFYSPLTFLIPSITLRSPLLEGLPEFVGWAWVMLTIPFMWIALNLSVRRAQDAGVSPWFGLAVLIPVFNFFVMFMLGVWPTRHPRPGRATADDAKQDLIGDGESAEDFPIVTAAAIGIGIGMLLTLVITALSVLLIHSYGTALFLGMPLVSGTVAGFQFNRFGRRSLGTSCLVGCVAVLFGGFSLLLFAIEGVLCLAMAAPLLLPLGAFGGLFGYGIANAGRQGASQIGGALLIIPLVAVVEPEQTRTYVAETSLIIAADAPAVWETVIAFPEIRKSPGGYFEYGIAWPIRARIEGQGVGAVRYCEFTTGCFVEPITRWQPPHRLSFDVTEQPDPMVELTPWRHIHPPHLKDSFRSVRGEFRLVELPDGRTRLEGSTWYQLKIGPAFYWKIWTDKILHDIHWQVLDHIREVTENR